MEFRSAVTAENKTKFNHEELEKKLFSKLKIEDDQKENFQVSVYGENGCIACLKISVEFTEKAKLEEVEEICSTFEKICSVAKTKKVATPKTPEVEVES